MLPVNFLFALDFILMIWRIWAIVTEQSHVLYFDLKGHSIYMTSRCFSLTTVVLMPFVAFCLGLVWLISVCLVTV